MATQTKYAGSISQTTGGNYGEWSGLNNIKNNENTTALCDFNGKSAQINRPSKLILKNFGFNIPTGARINSITVEYAHNMKTWMADGSVPLIPAPTIKLLNVNAGSLKGQAPVEDYDYHNKTVTFNYSTKNLNEINSSNFGLEFDYPANTNENTGRIFLKYIRITVNYTEVAYNVNVQSRWGGDNYADDPFEAVVSIIDMNNIRQYDPTVEIELPNLCVFTNATGDGTIRQEGNRLYWKAPLISKGMYAEIHLFFIPTQAGTYVIKASESITNAAQSLWFTVLENYGGGIIAKQYSTNIVTNAGSGRVEKLYVKQDTALEIQLSQNDNPIQMSVDVENFSWRIHGDWTYITNNGNATVVLDAGSDVDSDRALKLRFHVLGKRTVTFKDNYGTVLKTYQVYVTPSDPGVLSASVLQVPKESCNLMGDGYVYTAQTYLKVTTDVSGARFVDCGRNLRMLIFNDEIPEDCTTDALKLEYMVENAEFLSDTVSTTGRFESVTCDFVYHEEYPLYVLFTSDYSGLGQYHWDLQFVTPCIVEKIVYKKYEKYGNYPSPINNVISTKGLASVKVPVNKQCNSFILSKPPLPEWYGTGEDIAVVGIQLDFDVDYSDDLVLYAKLHAPDGRVGTRTVIINSQILSDNGNRIRVGGLNDLFGFDVLDIEDFNKWEIELFYDNIANSNQANVLFNNAVLTVYAVKVEPRYVNMFVDDKDMAYYGLFLQDVEIPEGLETDTKYLNIDGTDTNEAYRMNIDKKIITIEFTVDGCDINETTLNVRRIAQMLLNKRDSLNRPIPKKVAFSHYPDVYWEYVIEDAIDSEIEYGDYTCKVKLVVPSGTAKSIHDTVTNSIGSNNSIAKINPIIEISPKSEEMVVSEEYTGQSFRISNSNLSREDIVVIDCIKRQVLVKRNGGEADIEDIGSSADLDVDWFIIQGEYLFNCVGCVLQTVRFTERW